MCGRFALSTDTDTITQQFDLPTPPPQLAPRYNIAPTQPVLAIRHHPHTNQRHSTHFRWGLIPSWAKDPQIGNRLINARSETAHEKPSFRAAFKRRRCLIPISGFYEWQKTASGKQPHYIHMHDHQPFAVAGLWEYWSDALGNEIESCTLLTTTPNNLMKPLHNRMPVIIDPTDYDEWLTGPATANHHHLLRPYPAEPMAAYPISTYVNSPANEGAQCIIPLSA